MKYSVIWFTYREDEALLMESVTSVQRTFKGQDAKYTVVDDGFCACSQAAVDALESVGVDYKRSHYPRCGNLLGHENLQGQVEEMVEAAKDSEVLIKIDSDSILLKKDWIDDLLNHPTATMTASYKRKHNYPIGQVYAIKSHVLPALLDDVKLYPAWVNCFEDYEIGTRLHRIAGGNFDYAIRWRSGIEDGFWLCEPHQVDQRAESARSVNCGFSYHAQPPHMKAQYKADMLRIMRTINKAIGDREAAEQAAEQAKQTQMEEAIKADIVKPEEPLEKSNE